METSTSLSARSLRYYVIARQWAQDIEFYAFEIGFLYNLLDSHFFAINNIGERENVHRVRNELMRIEVEKNQLERLLAGQLKHLELMAEDVIPEDVSWLTGRQIQLEYRVAAMFGEYKELKTKVFSVMEKVLVEARTSGNCSYLN